MSNTRKKPPTPLAATSEKLLQNATSGHTQQKEKKEEHQATNTLRRYAQVEQNEGGEDENIHARLLPNAVENNESDEEEDKLKTALLKTEETGRATLATGFKKIEHDTRC